MIALYWITAFLSGAAALVVELAATRVLAPYFGQALFVWTNVIGLILFGLAIGNFVGGRLADRTVNPRLLARLLLAAALLVALSAWLPRHVATAVLPQNMPLDSAYEFLLKGSFVATLICFVPPVILLGAVPPFLVRCAAERIESVGTRSGALYGASTLGSIAGTFATSHLLLSWLGTRGTLVFAAALLAAAGCVLLVRHSAPKSAALGLLLVAAGAGALGSERVRAAEGGMALGSLVVARDSKYQHLEVRERDLRKEESDPPFPARVLALDEGHDSFQSVRPLEGVLTGGLYYDYFNLMAAVAATNGSLRVLVLGFGAGTHAMQLLHFFGALASLRIDGVELDPEVVALARRELGWRDDPRVRLYTDLDARVFVDHARERYDLVIVDCYQRQSFLPHHLASKEFFAAARGLLDPHGIMALNVFGYGAHDPVVRAVSNTLASAFEGGAAVVWVPETANFLVYAGADGAPELPRDWRVEWPEELAPLHERLLRDKTAFRFRWRPSELTLADDDGVLDRLQELRLAERARALLETSPGAPK